MKNDNLNMDFIEKCKKVDFSAESVNKEKNLEILKTKLSNWEKERGTTMKRKIKKPIALVAVAATLLCLSMAVYGQDLWRIIKTVRLGNYAEYNVMEDLRESIPVPENLAGQLFDKDGNVLTAFAKDEERHMYNADGEEVTIYFDGESAQIMTAEEYEKLSKPKSVEFTDIQEGTSYFITDVLMPTYLPDGYSFKNISFFGDSKEKINSEEDRNKYMNVYYSNGEDEIYSQIRFMDERTAFGSGASAEVKTVKINGYDAVVDGNHLDIQIGDVMYMFFANENLDTAELIKIAESLK